MSMVHCLRYIRTGNVVQTIAIVENSPLVYAAEVANALDEAGLAQQHVDEMPHFVFTSHVLGWGAYGEVTLAFRYVSHFLWRRMAVKRLAPRRSRGLWATLAIIAKAGREVALSRAAQASPYILPITEAWFDSRTGSVYLSMVAGDESLHSYAFVRHGGRLPSSYLLSICAQCAMALMHLHAANVVHRDVKPSNFIVKLCEYDANPPRVWLTDFGLSAAVDDGDMADRMIGTAEFLSPESRVDHAGWDIPTARDVWSLGITFVYLATGSLPTFTTNGVPLMGCPPQGMDEVVSSILDLARTMLRTPFAERPTMPCVVHCLCAMAAPSP